MSSSSTLPVPAPEHIRSLFIDSQRMQALERLYRRRDAVDNLIQSLEEYENVPVGRGAKVLSISVGPRCSSGSARLRI